MQPARRAKSKMPTTTQTIIMMSRVRLDSPFDGAGAVEDGEGAALVVEGTDVVGVVELAEDVDEGVSVACAALMTFTAVPAAPMN